MIEATTIPQTRSRVWTAEDAAQAYAILTDAENPQPVKYGEYESESLARTRGMALDRLIHANHGKRFGVSVWKQADGKWVGALKTTAPQTRTAKPKGRGK